MSKFERVDPYNVLRLVMDKLHADLKRTNENENPNGILGSDDGKGKE